MSTKEAISYDAIICWHLFLLCNNNNLDLPRRSPHKSGDELKGRDLLPSMK